MGSDEEIIVDFKQEQSIEMKSSKLKQINFVHNFTIKNKKSNDVSFLFIFLIFLNYIIQLYYFLLLFFNKIFLLFYFFVIFQFYI